MPATECVLRAISRPSCAQADTSFPVWKANVVLQVITEFCSEFRSVIDGGSNDLNLNELSGGARISFVYHELFNNGIKSIDPFDQVKDGDIRTILYNSSVSTRRSILPSVFCSTLIDRRSRSFSISRDRRLPCSLGLLRLR